MRKTILFAAAIAALAAFSSCGGDTRQEQAENMLQEVRDLYGKGLHAEALAGIDSLRKTFPEALGARKEALKLYQEIEIARSQKELEATDSILAAVKGEYEKACAETEALKAKGSATAERLTALTLLRIKRDSLQTRFDVLCAKIRYIRKKQNPE